MPCAITVPNHIQEMLSASAVPWYLPLGAHPGWCSVTDLTTPATWQRIIAAYAQSYGFTQLSPAAACSLQSYAGRYAGTTLAVWASSGMVLTGQHAAWHALILPGGSTHGVCCPDLPVHTQGPARTVANTMVDHLTPILTACRTAQTITAKVAWGCVAAACAGVFGRIYKTVAAPHRPAVQSAANTVITHINAQPGRELIRWNLHDQPPGLTHDRTTCCLMRLAETKGACGTCPDITATERQTRQHNAVRNPLPTLPITWAVPT